MEGGDLGRGKRARAACGGYICFEDEADPMDNLGARFMASQRPHL
ncbi:hypothetical protein [Streptomyces sp. NPDC050485]